MDPHRCPAPSAAAAVALPAAPSLAAVSGERCTNCGSALAGRYCGECGEKRPDAHDYALVGLAHEALQNFTNLDGKIARSIRSLLRAPGELSEAYFSGRRGRFTKPLALFVTMNVVFFFIVPHTGLFRESFDRYTQVATSPRARTLQARAAASGEPLAVYRERFDGHLDSYKKSLLLYLIPAFALTSYLVHLSGGRSRRRRYLAEDVVHSIHTTTFFLVVSIFVILPAVVLLLTALRPLTGVLPAVEGVARAIDSNTGTGIMYTGAVGWYLVRAERRFYEAGRVAALVRGALLVVLFFAMMLLFRVGLFWLTLWTM